MYRQAIFSLALCALIAAPIMAADGSLPGSDWASIAKLPDFNGVWEVTFGGVIGGPPQKISLTPKYEAILQAYEKAPAQDTPMANCVPPGLPGIMLQPYPIEFLYTPGMVTIVIEAFSQVRHIYTDGRKHPADPDPTYNGNSIGRWEGDTLVVDTVGFTPDTPLGMNMGMRHSSKMHIVERFRLLDPNKLDLVMTIEDPEALAEPWVRKAVFARHRDWTIDEYVCQQNNRNSLDPSGKAGINLNQPK